MAIKSLSGIRKYAILFSTLVLCVLLFALLHNLKPLFDKIEKDYTESRAVNLSSKTSNAVLEEVLLNNGYLAEKKDAEYVADTLVARLKRLEYPNLYHLQKRAYGQVPMMVADSLGVLSNKVRKSKELIGLSDSLPSANELKTEYMANDLGNGSICVIVETEKEIACGDVPIRLVTYCFDSTGVEKNDTIFVKTDSHGKAQFNRLDTSRGYSVLPIKIGFEYGMTKGIHKGKFKKEKYIYKFIQQEHRVQMIDNATLRQIKNDGAITVRTPAEYKATVIKWFVLILLGWWLLSLVLVFQKRNFDPVMIGTAMFLTGFCVIFMFAIQNPLTEELRGVDMAKGVLMGLSAVIVIQFIDIVKFYQNRYKLEFDTVLATLNWLFLPFKRKVAWLAPILSGDYTWLKKTGALFLLIFSLPFGLLNVLQIHKLSDNVERFCQKLPKGFGWLLLAILLTVMLLTPIGQSIGGMKVNLKLGPLTFQPSEIAKYLILLFMAAFYTQRADTIVEYSRPSSKRMGNKLWSKGKTLGWVIIGLVVLMGLYAWLGDMGPALVLGVTFVLLYSLVKSKVNLENLSENDKWKRIFTCDFAMLIYGVISFAVFMIVGAIMGRTANGLSSEVALLGAMLWFVAWIAFGWLRHKQFFETALIMNMLVFAFVFGGQVMQKIPGLAGTEAAARFEQRTKMCVNTWGDLDIEHAGTNAEAVSNTQVANGLWGIATGGLTGQGLGKGNPNLIPAFHTDMILSSIGEETGWIGLLVVTLVLAILLRRMIVVGYRAGHPFAFYFCSGVAIVTGVQFFIIALGSSGMIPLTGITVPFLSYGRVSMILNLIAFGVVLSFSQRAGAEQGSEIEKTVRKRSVGEYNYPVSIVSWTFVVLALFTLCVWQYYGFWKCGNTLIHPAFVYNNQGEPLIEYNPRIALLTKEMWAGNIYDRNGVLLATSDKGLLGKEEVLDKLKNCGLEKTKMDSLAKAHSKRYYPFGEHLFFMLGDINNGLYFSYNENNPIGYMAEAQHLAYLRDYDNIMRDENGKEVRINLVRTTKGRFIDGSKPDTINYVVRDNKDLRKFLKSGLEGRPLKRHNEKVSKGKFDLNLTLDAKLQTNMQNRIKEYVQSSNLKNNNLMRISVVVLDAEKGDLLTSANYPLPNYRRLREEDSLGHVSYSDNRKDKKWTAYTDRDLGLTYQTQPGSTAKVMSAMAGIMKKGSEAISKLYMVYTEEKIDTKLGEPTGNVSLHDAIVESSNCYFVNSVNDMNLYKQLGEIYKATGVRIDREAIGKNGQTIIDKSLTPYFFYMKDISDTSVFNAEVSATSERGTSIYNKYIDKRAEMHEYRKMNWSQCAWAWGQGTLRATPLNMARVASIVVNNGLLAQTRYLLNESLQETEVCTQSLEQLKSYMKDQAKIKGGISNSAIGGKTGTPERSHKELNSKGLEVKSSKNDAWYIFFVEKEGVSQAKASKLAVVVRVERANATSRIAMQLTRDLIIPVLTENEYIK